MIFTRRGVAETPATAACRAVGDNAEAAQALGLPMQHPDVGGRDRTVCGAASSSRRRPR